MSTKPVGRFGVASKQIAFDSRLGKFGRGVYVALTTFADGDTRETWVGIPRLAKATGFSEDSVEDGTKELEAVGHVKVERRRSKTNLYTLLDSVSLTQAEKDPEAVLDIWGYVYASALEAPVSAHAKAAYWCLAIHADKLRIAKPSLTEIAQETGYSLSSIQRGMRELRKAEIVTTTRRHRGNPDEPEYEYHFASNLSQLHDSAGVVSQRVMVARSSQAAGQSIVSQRVTHSLPAGRGIVRQRVTPSQPAVLTGPATRTRSKQDHGNQDHRTRPAPASRRSASVEENDLNPLAKEDMHAAAPDTVDEKSNILRPNFVRGGAAAKAAWKAQEATESVVEEKMLSVPVPKMPVPVQTYVDEFEPIRQRVAELVAEGADLDKVKRRLGKRSYSIAVANDLLPAAIRRPA